MDKKAINLFDRATKIVPLLKYAWVLVAAACLLWLIHSFQVKVEDVCWFSVVILLLCFLAFAFSLFLDKKDPVIKVAHYLLVYIIVFNFGYFLTGVNPTVYAQLLARAFKVRKDSAKIIPRPQMDTKKPPQVIIADPVLPPLPVNSLQKLLLQGKTMENSIDNNHHRVILGDTVENWEDQCLKYLTPAEKSAFSHYCDSVALQKPCIHQLLSYLRKINKP